MRALCPAFILRLTGVVFGLQRRRQRGQVVVYSALLLTVLMGLAGAGVDYGLIVIESAKLQNALDAAALAGARALVTATSQATQDAAGEAAAVNYLSLHGYTEGVNGAHFTYAKSASDGGAWHDTMTIVGTVAKPTSFWRIIGINTTNLNQRAVAAAGAGMVDVMLSLDLSGSMQLSGTADLANLQNAVAAFITQMQIQSADPRGSQVGIARWAGINCSWARGKTRANTMTPTPPVPTPDGDTVIDFDRGEFDTPCYDDATVLSYLSQNEAQLAKISGGTMVPAPSSVACPTAPAAPTTPTPWSPASMSSYGCPLQSWVYPYQMVPVSTGTPTPATGVGPPSGTPGAHSWNGMTGTKLSNAIKIVNGNITGRYAWASGAPTNGRNNNMTSEGLARKVLVIMTDGVSEEGGDGIPDNYPSYGGTPAPLGWDLEVKNLATALKKGPDGNLSTTADNVEIYVVGFYCDAADAATSSLAKNLGWCSSAIAVTPPLNQSNSSVHPCPGGVYPPAGVTPSYTDNLLQAISSSTPGTCDHYFPIRKSENLPQLFRVMAGSIARGRLQ
jgi:Flp pilus assembly protein TadG